MATTAQKKLLRQLSAMVKEERKATKEYAVLMKRINKAFAKTHAPLRSIGLEITGIANDEQNHGETLVEILAELKFAAEGE